MMPLAQSLVLFWLLARLSPRRMPWLAAALGLAALIPFHGLSLAGTLRTLWGDPSITTLQLLILDIARCPPAAFVRGWRAPAIIAAFSLLFYPLALGMGDFDPWRLGFQPVPLLAVLSVPALLLWWRGQTLWCWLLSVNVAAYAAGLLESTNFWDYLLDPLLAIFCVVLAIRNRAFRRPEPESPASAKNLAIADEG